MKTPLMEPHEQMQEGASSYASSFVIHLSWNIQASMH